MDEVLYEATGRVARLTINRPERRNALSPSVIAGLRSGLRRARSDAGVRVVVLTGAGEKAFCAGADLVGMASEGGSPAPGVLAEHEARGELPRLFTDLWELGKPTIARVRGFALAGGFGLALACDLVVAADDAVFGTPEIDVGLWPYVITVPLLRSMPPKVALELMMTGRRVGAAEAASLGFVTKVVPVPELDRAVEELATVLAAKPPGVLGAGRSAFYSVLDLPARDALRYLHAMLTITVGSEETREGVSAFAEKREPAWRRS
jgi:enoyl-CoA hydratase/carnithine racemase